jgi:hypothetical protein
MALFKGVFKKRPSSLSMAFLANQLSPITASRKSSRRKVTPLPKDPAPVSPVMNSGDKSIEKISRYRPHSILINEIVKITKARTPIRSSDGEYRVRRKPASTATSTNNIPKIEDRTIHLKPFYPALAFLYFPSIGEPVWVLP